MMNKLFQILLALLITYTAEANVFGPDSRKDVLKGDDKLWSKIVKIVAAGGEECTGTLIAENWVLTAAHCVLPAIRNPKAFNFDGSDVPANKSTYSLVIMTNYKTRTYDASSDAKKIYVGLSSLTDYKKNYFKDFALIELKKPLGKKYGFIPVNSNQPFIGDRLWFSSYDRLTYARDNRGATFGVWNQTKQEDNCTIKNILPTNAIYHDCDSEIGASGSGLLSCISIDQCEVIGVHVAEQRNGGPRSIHMENFDEKFTNFGMSLYSIKAVLAKLGISQ